MKIKKLLSLTVAVLFMSFYTFGQIEQAETPMFGTSRGMSAAFSHNFKIVSGTAQTYQFKIKNDGGGIMKIVDVKMDEQVGVTIVNKEIKNKEDGIIVVTIDPTISKKGKFSKQVVVFTEQRKPGIVTKKEITFSVTGIVK